MGRREVQFSVQEAGCLVYVTDRSVIAGTAGEGPVTGGELCQDDGYTVRVVEASSRPRSGTTGRRGWRQLPTGQMIVAGILDLDFDRWLAQFGSASLGSADGGEHELGCIVEVEPGQYTVEFYGYPPNDLAAGWMRIEDPEMFDQAFGESAGGSGREWDFRKPDVCTVGIRL